jgi:hypothetical protein
MRLVNSCSVAIARKDLLCFDPRRASAQWRVAGEVSLNALDTDSDRTGPIENRNVTKHHAE